MMNTTISMAKARGIPKNSQNSPRLINRPHGSSIPLKKNGKAIYTGEKHNNNMFNTGFPLVSRSFCHIAHIPRALFLSRPSDTALVQSFALLASGKNGFDMF